MNRACFPKEKHQNSQKNGREIHENFSFWPFLWFGLPGRLSRELMHFRFFGRLVFPSRPGGEESFPAPTAVLNDITGARIEVSGSIGKRAEYCFESTVSEKRTH